MWGSTIDIRNSMQDFLRIHMAYELESAVGSSSGGRVERVLVMIEISARSP
jgi:hypothetical protein